MATYTQSQLDAMTAAFAAGILTVRYNGRETTYRSLDELERIIDVIKRDLGQSPTDRFTFSSFSRS